MNDKDPIDPDQTLITKGVTSVVYEYNDAGRPAGKYGRYGVGHIALFDHDSHMSDPVETEAYFREHGIDGTSVVFKSSKGNYHTWNLKIRSFHETGKVLARGNDDTKHRQVGEDRGYWRLRAGPKLKESNDVYKPMPEAVYSFNVGAGHVCSGPHAEMIRKAHGEEWLNFEANRYRGNMTETIMYTTFTDAGKKIQSQSVKKNA